MRLDLTILKTDFPIKASGKGSVLCVISSVPGIINHDIPSVLLSRIPYCIHSVTCLRCSQRTLGLSRSGRYGPVPLIAIFLAPIPMLIQANAVFSSSLPIVFWLCFCCCFVLF